jgi:hypothetical protein
MPIIQINVGDAFLLENPPNPPHLYIAIAQTSTTKYLFVNVTSRRDKSDLSCILQPNTLDMPSYIKKESVINYLDAREIDSNQLHLVICAGSNIPKCRFPLGILSQIQQGGLVSKRLPNMYKNSLKAFLEL